MDYDHKLNEVFFESDAKDVVETVYGYDRIISVIDGFWFHKWSFILRDIIALSWDKAYFII